MGAGVICELVIFYYCLLNTVWPCSNEYTGNTNWTWWGFVVLFCCFVAGHVPRVEGVALVGIGNEGDQGTLYEIPKELI